MEQEESDTETFAHTAMVDDDEPSTLPCAAAAVEMTEEPESYCFYSFATRRVVTGDYHYIQEVRNVLLRIKQRIIDSDPALNALIVGINKILDYLEACPFTGMDSFLVHGDMVTKQVLDFITPRRVIGLVEDDDGDFEPDYLNPHFDKDYHVEELCQLMEQREREKLTAEYDKCYHPMFPVPIPGRYNGYIPCEAAQHVIRHDVLRHYSSRIPNHWSSLPFFDPLDPKDQLE